jgi:cytosine deaminase
MLVLARQRDESIVIGNDIVVTVVDIRGEKVRLGIDAPRSVSVHRKEVWEAIRKENDAASKLMPADITGLPPQPLRLTPGPAVTLVESAEVQGEHMAFMEQAIAEARMGLAEGGLPIGSVLVRGGQVIARGHNRRVQRGDPMAHAEIDCLAVAGRQKTYGDTVLYSTLMPCYLCSGAVVQFGIRKVVVGESLNFPGAPEFMRSHGVEVIDLNHPECIEMMGRFIREHPQLWHEDIGK